MATEKFILAMVISLAFQPECFEAHGSFAQACKACKRTFVNCFVCFREYLGRQLEKEQGEKGAQFPIKAR